MRRFCLIVVLVAVAAAGCARSTPGPAAPATAAGGPVVAGQVASGDTAQLYLAVLRRYLTTSGDNSNLTFARGFVVDHADPRAADPMEPITSSAGRPIAPADQAAIIAGLRDIAPVEFVGSRDKVIVSDHGCPTVRDHGIVIVLGPPTAAGRSTHVAINGFVACLGATWLTYVVEHDGNQWTVTGTTGTMAVA